MMPLKSSPGLHFIIALAWCAAISGCQFQILSPAEGTGGNGGGGFSCNTPKSASVLPVYPLAGSNWNDYVAISNSSLGAFGQADVACNAASANGHFSCIHGGEKRKIVLSGVTSCANLNASDQLGAFDWTCDVSSGTATFYSAGLKEGVGLRELVLATGFRDNAVTVTDSSTGCPVFASTPATWWGNSFDSSTLGSNPADTDAEVALTTPGTIYTLSGSTSTSGININADRISVVTLEDATLRYSGRNTGNCWWGSGGGEPFGGGARTVICSGSQNFIWIEAKTDGARAAGTDDAYWPIFVVESRFARIHRSQARRSTNTGANISLSRNVLVSDSQFSENVAHGLGVESTTYSTLLRVAAIRNGRGISLNNASDNNVLREVLVSNNSWNGLEIRADDSSGTLAQKDITVSKLVSFGNGSAGIGISDFGVGSSQYTLIHITSAMNGTGYGDYSDGRTVAANLLASNNSDAIYLSGLTDAKIHDVAYANQDDGFIIYSTSNLQVRGAVLHGSTTWGACQIDEGTTSGLEINDSCQYGSPAVSATTGLGLSSSFVGPVASDSANNSPLPTDAYANVTDWLNFENLYRGWGQWVNGATFATDATLRGHCTSGEDCRIYDLRLHQNDTVVREYFGTFNHGDPCPASVDGADPAMILTDYQTAPSEFLKHAFEVVGDHRGDEDGLCEDNEDCIFAPNFGAYQGEGDYRQTECNFNDGTISGVRMFRYPVNGGI